MNLSKVKFNKHDRPEFFKELRKRVSQYFEENNISKYANLNMKLKTVFMLLLYFVPLAILILGIQTSIWSVLAMWGLMGFGMSGIGLSIMHDANHGAYSKNKFVNNSLGFLLNFIGGYHQNWKIQHNVLHHSYTNIEGYDEDIRNNLMRFSPNRPRKKIYRYQAFYAPFLYSLMTIYWFVGKDYLQIIRYQSKNLLKANGINFRKAIAEISFHKSWYILLTLVAPMLTAQVSWWYMIIGFLLMQFICGLALALIFQPAHVIEDTSFVNPEKSENIENSWAIHQLQTTANFAHGSRLFSWFIGGLNYQVEHHLFPNICHVHYRKISAIVKQTAQEFGVPYHQHKTFFSALKSHFTLLHQFGTGEYDKKLA